MPHKTYIHTPRIVHFQLQNVRMPLIALPLFPAHFSRIFDFLYLLPAPLFFPHHEEKHKQPCGIHARNKQRTPQYTQSPLFLYLFYLPASPRPTHATPPTPLVILLLLLIVLISIDAPAVAAFIRPTTVTGSVTVIFLVALVSLFASAVVVAVVVSRRGHGAPVSPVL